MFHTRLCTLACIWIWFAAILPAQAELKVTSLIGHNAVLQKDMPVPVWGWAERGETVTVRTAGQTAQGRVDQNGRWEARLGRMKAGGPWDMTIEAGTNKIIFTNIVVGEVWLCAGQSNMEWPLQQCPHYSNDIAAADFPMIRCFSPHGTVPWTNTPQSYCNGGWSICTPSSIRGCSAVAFFFGRELHRQLTVPVGLLCVPHGGTPISSWTSLEAQEAVPEIKRLIRNHLTGHIGERPAAIYNGTIAPLAPYAVRGAIWYQGEYNASLGPSAALYGLQLDTLIKDWRKSWGQGDNFHFISVQLPNFGPTNQVTYWPLIREGVLKSLALPNVGMAVTIDVGDERDLHPPNKLDVGKRLALWALANTYHKKGVVGSGPIYTSMSRKADRIILKFDYTDDGLMIKGGNELAGFMIAGPDQRFFQAQAKIEGTTVVVSSPEIKEPAAVRYSWAGNPAGNLYNKAGLPASPFRTDDWSIDFK